MTRRNHARAIALSLLAVLAACTPPSSEHDAGAPTGDVVVPLEPPSPDEGFQVTIEAFAPKHEEIWKCEVIRELPGDDLFHYVHRVKSRQNAGMHHADLMSFFFTGLSLTPGQYDCDELYATYPELMEQGLFVYGSQAAEEEIVLPEGVAAPLPRDSAYMFEVHYVNASDQDVVVESYVNAYTMPEDDVTETIYGNVNRDFDILIPAGATDHVEWTRCVFNKDADIHFLQSHTHERADRFELRAFDGETVGPLVYENDDWHAPKVMRLDPPMHITAGTGFEYTCFYSNPTDTDVVWGFNASDEMCQFGYVFTPGDTDIVCETVASSDGLGIAAE